MLSNAKTSAKKQPLKSILGSDPIGTTAAGMSKRKGKGIYVYVQCIIKGIYVYVQCIVKGKGQKWIGLHTVQLNKHWRGAWGVEEVVLSVWKKSAKLETRDYATHREHTSQLPAVAKPTAQFL